MKLIIQCPTDSTFFAVTVPAGQTAISTYELIVDNLGRNTTGAPGRRPTIVDVIDDGAERTAA